LATAEFHADPEPRPVSRVGGERCRTGIARASEEAFMATQNRGQIIETPTEARQGERGPSVLALLTVSTGLAVLILGVIWFVWFRV
jgi:hypothetical protein